MDKTEKAGINFNNDPNACIEYSNSMDDILSDIDRLVMMDNHDN